MKRDRRQVLESVIEFIGVSCNEVDLALAVEEGSFERMRQNEEMYGAQSYSGTRGERGYFTRNGTVDGWKTELPASVRGRIEREFAATMQRVGYRPDST
jgi:hypothetical protein